MKKLTMLFQIGSVIFCIFSIVMFGIIYKDLSKMGLQSFDVTKWLDADSYLLKWGWYSLILGTVFLLLSLTLNLTLYRNKKLN